MKKWISWLSVVLGVFPFLILLWPLDLNSGIKYPRDVAAAVIPCIIASISCILLNINDVRKRRPLSARRALSVMELYIAMFPFLSAAFAMTATLLIVSRHTCRAWEVSGAAFLICGILHIVPISNAVGLILRLPSLTTGDGNSRRNLHIGLQFIPVLNIVDSWHLLQISRYEGEQISRARWATLYMGLLILLILSLLLARFVIWWILT